VKKPKYVLDSYALLAFFQAEPGGEKVHRILKEAFDGRCIAFLSVISLGEIFYIVARRRGRETARAILEDVSRLPLNLVDAGMDRVLAAAEMKARHPISYADAFVAAAAEELSAILVTGDPELKQVVPVDSLLWL
jgi:ribonuclease VapC